MNNEHDQIAAARRMRLDEINDLITSGPIASEQWLSELYAEEAALLHEERQSRDYSDDGYHPMFTAEEEAL